MTGRAAELWHSDTGKMEPASYATDAGRTRVPLTLQPYETVFVVFREAGAAPARTLPVVRETTLASVDGAWSLSFESGKGAPEAALTMERLASWSENGDPG